MNYTKTVWKDLPDTTTPLNASNLNHIEDGIKALYEKTLYSTTEQVVGTWIDGKPIYRKVVLINSISGTNVNEIAVPTNIDTMLPNVCGIVYDNSGNGYFINYNNVYNTDDDIGAFYYKTHNCISIKQYAEFNINNGYIIIEYTKTTD